MKCYILSRRTALPIYNMRSHVIGRYLNQLQKMSNMHMEHVLMCKHGKHILLKDIHTVAAETHFEVNAILIGELNIRRLI